MHEVLSSLRQGTDNTKVTTSGDCFVSYSRSVWRNSRSRLGGLFNLKPLRVLFQLKGGDLYGLQCPSSRLGRVDVVKCTVSFAD